jgi:hypothetical protein
MILSLGGRGFSLVGLDGFRIMARGAK